MGNYVTVDDLKKEGLPAGVSDALANRRILKWESIVERYTRNFFYEVSPGELTFDGNNSSYLHFNVPLIEVTSLKINGDTVALDTDEYRAFVGRMKPQDDRYNPKIRLTPIRQSLYRTHPSMFVKGLDQLIDAKWGFLEPDDSTPQPVKDAVIKLVLLDIDGYFDQGGGNSTQVSPVKRERTDGHEIEYMEVAAIAYVSSLFPADIAEVLGMYRSPLAIDSPEPVKFWYDPGIEVHCL